MPRPKQTPEQLAATRERILDAAREILLDEGPEAISIRAIASRLQVSPMSLYTYFPNRAALVDALKTSHRARIRAMHEDMLRRAREGDPCAVTREALAGYAQMAEERPRLYRFLWVVPQENAGPAQFRARRARHHLQHLAQLIALGIARGCFAPHDPQVAAATAFAIANAPLFMHHSGHLPDDELFRRVVAEAQQAALRYLCTPAGSAEGGALEGAASAQGAAAQGAGRGEPGVRPPDDAAGPAGVSHVFVADGPEGKEQA